MDGLTLLRRAHDAGLAVAAEGDKLVIRGPKRAEPVALLLIEHKPEVLATLAPAQRAAQQWRDHYAARISHWFLHGRRRWQDAEALAYGELLNEWHMLHGARSAQWQCAGCDKPIAGRPALILMDGDVVHFEALDCLLSYGDRWRRAAVAGLHTVGLNPPTGFDPIATALPKGVRSA
jgi:hypothetical protein